MNLDKLEREVETLRETIIANLPHCEAGLEELDQKIRDNLPARNVGIHDLMTMYYVRLKDEYESILTDIPR